MNPYLDKALESELAILMNAPNGDRSNQLVKSAFALGQLICDELPEHQVKSLLLQAGLELGLDPKQVDGAVRRGIEKGKLDPRQVPTKPRPAQMQIHVRSGYPPWDGLEKFWNSSNELDDESKKYLESRGFNTNVIYFTGLAKTLRNKPGWWSASRDFSIFIQAFDWHGKFRSIHARAANGRKDKTRWPDGCSASELVFANRHGLCLLRGEHCDAKEALIVEGATDFLKASTDGLNVNRAVFGITSGSIPLFKKLTINLPVFYSCDDDKAGNDYAKKLRDIFPTGRRLRLPDGKDYCSATDLEKQDAINRSAIPDLPGITFLQPGPIVPIRWLWKNWIYYNGICIIVADGFSGKSFLVTEFILALLYRDNFLGDPVYPSVDRLQIKPKILVYSPEEFGWIIEDRIKRICLSRDIPQEIIMPQIAFIERTVYLDREADVDFLNECVNQYQPMLLVFDPFIYCSEKSDEDKASETKLMMQNFRTLCRSWNSVIIIHHTRKDGKIRGSSNIRNSSDIVLKLSVNEQNQKELTIDKLKNAPMTNRMIRFTIEDDRFPNETGARGVRISRII